MGYFPKSRNDIMDKKEDNLIFIPSSKSSKKQSWKGQSAIDFLITYSWVILILGVIVGILFIYVSMPTAIVPDQCTFENGANCIDILLTINSSTKISEFEVLVSNTQQYPVLNPSLIVSINGVNASGSCDPNFLLSGGEALCVVNMPIELSVGALESGNLYLVQKDCAAINTFNESECGAVPAQTFLGHFTVHATTVLPNKPDLTTVP